ncbi:MAG: hypothetical protein OJF49_001865 [Ktedonobacterales bacterium]|nr:MAG: hypothetical protein OJF49_001865 [Ktedonobacterales bacterium]
MRTRSTRGWPRALPAILPAGRAPRTAVFPLFQRSAYLYICKPVRTGPIRPMEHRGGIA